MDKLIKPKRKKRSLCVVIPTYNEDPKYLAVVLKACKLRNIETLVVDDGSDYPVRGADIRWSKNKGAGASFKAGVKKATTTHIAVIDADAQYDIIDLIEMWESMEDEDSLIGARICHQGNWRRWAGRLFLRMLASFLSLRYIRDLNPGIRIMKRKIALNFDSIICDEFSYSASYTLCFLLEGYHVNWVPIGFYPRQGARSTVKLIRHGLIATYTIIRICFALRTRRIRNYLRNK